MSLFASFNGGPTEQAILYALLGGALVGAIIGGITASAGKRIACGVCLLAAGCAMLVAALITTASNQRGDAADLFLVGSLVMLLPLAGVLGTLACVLTAAVIQVFQGPRMRTELYWIETTPPGKLAIMPRPRGGDWLDEEIAFWQRLGIGVVVSALTAEEKAELNLIPENEQCERAGIQFLAFPIADRGVPLSAEASRELVLRLQQDLAQGKKIVIHCRQGVGRAALLAACVLAGSGVDPALAWQRIATARGCAVPDTNEQREWVFRFTREILAPFTAEGPSEG